MKKILLASLMLLGLVSCDDFLTKDPLTSFQDDDFWCNENNVRGFAMGYYAARFPGYGSGDSGGTMSQRQALNDDFTNTSLSGFAAAPIVKGGSWGSHLSNIRRDMLLMGTKLKYDPATTTEQMEHVAKYLQAAKDAAWRVISSNRYSLCPSFHDLFSTIDISQTAEVKQEMILWRQYATGQVTHAIMTYDRDLTVQGQSGTKDLINSYLCLNGMPINTTAGVNPQFKGDKSADNEMSNRDPRLNQTFKDDFYVQYGEYPGYAQSGYKRWLFLNKQHEDDLESTQSFNITDAPIIRLGEVMLNYIEAAAELETLGKYTVTQEDVDATINKLRTRASFGGKLAKLQIIGGQPAVNGVVFDDADRDPDVPSFLWEIRRERRVELVYQGFRLNDLKRWRKIHYLNSDLYPKKTIGCWLKKSDQYKNLILCDENGIVISNAGNAKGEGYIKVSMTPRNADNGYVLDRNYWDCIPLYEIDYYERNGSHLEQNPGWPQGGADAE